MLSRLAFSTINTSLATRVAPVALRTLTASMPRLMSTSSKSGAPGAQNVQAQVDAAAEQVATATRGKHRVGFDDPAAREIMSHEQEADEEVFHEVEHLVEDAEKNLLMRVRRALSRIRDARARAVGFNDPAAREIMSHEQEADEEVLHEVEHAVVDVEQAIEKWVRNARARAVGFDDPAAREIMSHEQEADEEVFHEVEHAVEDAEKAVFKKVHEVEERVLHAVHDAQARAVGFNDPAAREIMSHEQEADAEVLHEVEHAVEDAEKAVLKKVLDVEKDMKFTEVHEHMPMDDVAAPRKSKR